MADVFAVQGRIELDDSNFHEAVDDAIKEGEKLADSLGEQTGGMGKMFQNAFSFSIGNLLSNAMQEAFQYLKEFTVESISVASSLQEVQNVVDVTFGDGSKQIEQWANAARRQYGLTELQAKQYTSTMGAMLKSMGLAEDEVLDMSTAMAGLAADMASFYNLDFDAAFDKIRSGISGETEPLRQLGINMSVANIEAFALSQGITETYESMTEAERAVLRYNYLLQATADAQGDFARTSDSYANNLRTFQANIDSLKASLGEELLPVLNDALTWANALLDGSLGGLSGTLHTLEKSYEENADSIELNQRKAEALLDTIAELENKESLTTDETLRYKGAVEALIGIYPELNQYVDASSGMFTSNASALREETAALKENYIIKAQLAYNEERLSAAAMDYVKKQEEYKEATKKAATKAGEHAFAYEKYMEAVDGFLERLPSMFVDAGFDRPTNEAIENMRALVVEGKNVGDAFNDIFSGTWAAPALGDGFVTDLVGIEKLRGASENLHRETTRAEEAVNTTKTAMDKSLASYEALAEEITGTTEAINEAGEEANDAADNFEGMTDNTSAFKAELEKLKTEGENVVKLFDELEQYKLNNLESMRKQVEGVYDTFDKADKVRKTSAKKMNQGLQSQIDQLERWKEAYAELEANGASEELLASFDFSTDSIAQMEALNKSGAEGVAETNSLLAQVQANQSEVATTMSEASLAVDDYFQGLSTAAETAANDLSTHLSAIQEAASTMQADVAAATDAAGEGVVGVQTVGDLLGLSEWEPYIGAKDEATAMIAAVEAALNDLDGKKITVYINAEKSGFDGSEDGGTSHATGLDYVPYDEYAALLHKGEAVLTKAEADNWRKGRTNMKAENGGIHVTQNIQAVPMTPHELAVQTASALELLRFRV